MRWYLLLLLFVTEQATVLGWVILRQGIDTFCSMAFSTEFFSLFFSHGHKPLMVLVVRQPGGCFRWGAPEKQEQSGAKYEKKGIVDYYFLFFVHPGHILNYR